MPTNFTREQLNRANEVDLLGYVTERYPTKAHGNGTYKLQIEGHDSLVVFPNTNSWYDFNRQIGGDTVAFLTKHEGKNMVNAVRELIGETFDPQKLFDRNKALAIPKEDLILPDKAENDRRVFAYLIKTRGIDRDLVKSCIDDGSIYQSKEIIQKGEKVMTFNNCIFVGKDENDTPKYASQRSMNDNTSFVLKSDVKNSQKEYGFVLKGDEKADWLTVCESPIDVLSIASLAKLRGEKPQNEHILSLGGVSDKAIDKFLETNKDIKVINICLDNDQAGRTSGEQIKAKYSELGYTVVESYPKLKDYNLELSRAIAQNNRPTIDAPLAAANNNRTFAYLTNTKLLNSDLVNGMIKSGEIYQTDKDVVLPSGETKSVSNTVFANRNADNEIEYAIAVSYNNSSDRADFKVEYINDKQTKNYISRVGDNTDLLVFNNPISMLTHQSYLLSAGQPNKNNYLCCIGEPQEAVKQFISDNPQVKNVKVMHDKSSYISPKTGQLIDIREISFNKISKTVTTKKVNVTKKYPKEMDLNKDYQAAKSSSKENKNINSRSNEAENGH